MGEYYRNWTAVAVLTWMASALVAPTLAAAETRLIEPVPKWQLAGAFGTPRLYLKSLLTEQPQGASETVGTLARSLAVGPRVDFGQPDLRFRLSPSLVYDDNINGGLPFDTFDLGPFQFTVDEDSKARAGLTVGARASLAADVALVPGLMLSSSAQLGYRHSPRHDIGVSESSFGACLRYTSDSWTYVDGCLSNSRKQTDLTDTTLQTQTVTLGHLFDSAFASREVSVALSRQSKEGVDQNLIRLNARNLIGAIGAIDVGLTLGEKVEGSLRQTSGVDFGYGAIVFGRPTRLSLGYTEETGGSFFGQDRSDQVLVTQLSRNVSQNIRVFVNYEDRQSNRSAFSRESWGFGLEYLGFRW